MLKKTLDHSCKTIQTKKINWQIMETVMWLDMLSMFHWHFYTHSKLELLANREILPYLIVKV